MITVEALCTTKNKYKILAKKKDNYFLKAFLLASLFHNIYHQNKCYVPNMIISKGKGLIYLL